MVTSRRGMSDIVDDGFTVASVSWRDFSILLLIMLAIIPFLTVEDMAITSMLPIFKSGSGMLPLHY